MWIISIAFLCSVAFCTATRQEYGLCSQVYLMSQYCSSNDVPPAHRVKVARGPAGKPGRPGIANYTKVEEKIAAKMKEVEKKFESKFEEYETIMNRTVSRLEKELEKKFESKFEEYETIMNRTVSRLEKELEEKFESKFEEYETIMNRTVSRLEKTETIPRTISCDDAKLDNAKVKSGTGEVFHIDANGIDVFCDLTTDGGRWTVFQRRFDGSQDFDQNWSNYVAGFGDLTGEFWLGLEKIHLLMQGGTYELRVEMTDQNDRIGIAKYKTLSVSGSSENYRLNVGGFSGTGVSDWLAYHNNMAFTTKDRDNDRWSGNCAVSHGPGGWWFNACHNSMLNKPYGSIRWHGFSENIKKTEMKFRKK